MRVCEYNERVFVKCNIMTVTRGKFEHFPFSTDKGERIALLKFQIWRRRLN